MSDGDADRVETRSDSRELVDRGEHASSRSGRERATRPGSASADVQQTMTENTGNGVGTAGP